MASPKYFFGKIITITGGAGGIGLNLARTLYHQGAKVSIADAVSQDKLDKLVTSIRQETSSSPSTAAFRATSLDVRDVPAVDNWVKDTVQDFGGPLNGAVNMAAVMGKWAFYHTVCTFLLSQPSHIISTR
jgi:NAD(P)-dependent dehydrogenase (short-subunit alcohol dehydrogenase family)